MYQIELSANRTGHCVKKELTEPFHRIEVPQNATFVGEAVIGSNAAPGLGVNVVLFIGKTGEGGKISGGTESRGGGGNTILRKTEETVLDVQNQ